MIDADLPSKMVSRAQTLVPDKLRGAETVGIFEYIPDFMEEQTALEIAKTNKATSIRSKNS